MPEENNVPHRPPVSVERRRWPRVSQEPLGKDENTAASLVALRFETESLPRPEQFPAWREHISSLAEARLPDNVAPDDGFPVRQAVWNLGGMLLLQQTVPAFSYERSLDMVRFSPLDHWLITFLRTGRSWTGIDGRVTENEPGMMEIRSLGNPFSGRALESESLTLIVPDDQFADRGGLPPASSNTVLGGRRVKLMYDHMVGLETNLGSLAQDDLPSIKSRLLEVIFDTTTPFLNRGGESERVSQIGMMTRARRLIRKNLISSDLTPDALSRELAISRTRLYELFESVGGVAKYMRQHRLLAAHRMLADPSDRRTIAEVSLAIGYDSAANFSRAFTQQFGYSPSNIRTHRASSDVQVDVRLENNAVTFDGLLQTLGVHT
ncbi:AraC family transcriptional regulator [Mesorhizobium sp. ESP7-2]|uniref:helix-turn-helix transcriptional regulator n=1 Tax=Mesorhizobium sp. ESP7-2 TaxID=2876622 RepID=UPI001CCFEC19|nr:AraC family transcriptional regulator [Mesorhizobium sp. ESP7-2]MBZ9711114.1 AraC family transcriptional regulator [Mesorhizobium sp. ESP7-2]